MSEVRDVAGKKDVEIAEFGPRSSCDEDVGCCEGRKARRGDETNELDKGICGDLSGEEMMNCWSLDWG